MEINRNLFLLHTPFNAANGKTIFNTENKGKVTDILKYPSYDNHEKATR